MNQPLPLYEKDAGLQMTATGTPYIVIDYKKEEIDLKNTRTLNRLGRRISRWYKKTQKKALYSIAFELCISPFGDEVLVCQLTEDNPDVQ